MKIGLTYTGSEQKHNNYINWVKGADAIEVITLSVAQNNLNEVANCDGIVLSGGVDISPEYYQGDITYANAPEGFQKDRDDFETAVFAATQKNGIPVLGICRGMQLVNCIYGGSLEQDLGEKNTVHRVANNLDKVHGVTVVAGSLLYDITGSEHVAVNSAHHQALGRIGTNLRVTATSADGVAEALEWQDATYASFLLCVQWHPERMFTFGLQDNSPSKGLREKFLNAIKRK
ncbi:MAG: gamma-glutamyl-gamma-aminobutyrate hydrolase family protein [Niabella sp.]|nr:gamma-glutamyl-gamma-aminobutyrate hydrolase family protein [Niabella sp.]